MATVVGSRDFSTNCIVGKKNEKSFIGNGGHLFLEYPEKGIAELCGDFRILGSEAELKLTF